MLPAYVGASHYSYRRIFNSNHSHFVPRALATEWNGKVADSRHILWLENEEGELTRYHMSELFTVMLENTGKVQIVTAEEFEELESYHCLEEAPLVTFKGQKCAETGLTLPSGFRVWYDATAYGFDVNDNMHPIDELVFSEHEQGYIHEDECFTCEYSGGVFFLEEAVTLYNYDMVHEDTDDLERSECGEYFISSECHPFRYCEYDCEWVHEDTVTYCDHCDECYDYERHGSCPNGCGDCGNGRVGGYHDSQPQAVFSAFSSKYTIGFEIERNSLCGSIDDEGDDCEEIDGCELVAGVETDSSCGVEVVSNILPLSSGKKEEVFNAIDECSDWLDNDVEAGRDCGGHITIAGEGLDREVLTPYLAIWFSLFRYRLKNTYCRENVDGKQGNTKYSPLNWKGGNMYELRIPSAVKSSNSLKFRYSLALSMVEAIDGGVDAVAWMNSAEVEKLLNTVYDDRKTLELMHLANGFRDFLVNGKVSTQVSQFLP